MNVFYLSDEKFCEIFATSVVSLFEYSKNEPDLRVFLIENNISDLSKKRIQQIANQYNRSIELIPMPQIEELMGTSLYIASYLNLVDYARLFAGSILPPYVERAIQLDCDLVLQDSLRPVWDFELGDNFAAMINEGQGKGYRKVLGLSEDGGYFNSGVMLCDIKKWRDNNIEKDIVQYVQQRSGYIPVAAQGVINAVLDGKIGVLPLRSNVFTHLYAFSYKDFLKLRTPTYFYSEEEYENAKKNPIAVHYMTCFYMDLRPWMAGCIHTKKDLFMKYHALTPWSNSPLWNVRRKKSRAIYEKVVHALPKPVAVFISNAIYVQYIPWKQDRLVKQAVKNSISTK
jgi:lipopolysaccharide biosynthesis glycosyltransferase